MLSSAKRPEGIVHFSENNVVLYFSRKGEVNLTAGQWTPECFLGYSERSNKLDTSDC